MLSDRTIHKLLGNGTLGILGTVRYPIEDAQYQPASVDLRLGDILGSLSTRHLGVAGWWLPIQAFRIGSTIETITLGDRLAGRVEGKSSWARRGLMVHCAGFVDPGFTGQITLELYNFGPAPIFIEEGKRIAQICFDWMDNPPGRLYGHPELRSRYQGQRGPTPAREWEDVEIG